MNTTTSYALSEKAGERIYSYLDSVECSCISADKSTTMRRWLMWLIFVNNEPTHVLRRSWPSDQQHVFQAYA